MGSISAPEQPKAEPTSELPDSRTSEVTKSESSEVSDSQGSADGPKWQSLERKETRLRTDQLAELAALRRRVSGQRRNRSEIITDNTLIRVAVDLLLTRAGRLRGDTEAELLASLAPRRRTQD
ncbi:hypothetical protein [Streptomyces sp. NPDC056682]|uniref:hypothetical protein n=1 Tax=Streptomyces sp. NPDC056682 TaxID=3345909 RepID=UPI0036A91940